MIQKLGNFTLRPATKAQRWIGGTAVSLTSVLDEDVWLTPSPGRFIPQSDRYPLRKRLGGPHGRFGQVRNVPPPNRNPPTLLRN